MPFIAKTAPFSAASGETVRIEERPFYGGRDITAGDRMFVWLSERQGGKGLFARGTVVRVVDPGQRIVLDVQIDNCNGSRRFGVEDIAPYRDREDGSPLAGLAHKLYRHAHNKITTLTTREAAILEEIFR